MVSSGGLWWISSRSPPYDIIWKSFSARSREIFNIGKAKGLHHSYICIEPNKASKKLVKLLLIAFYLVVTKLNYYS